MLQGTGQCLLGPHRLGTVPPTPPTPGLARPFLCAARPHPRHSLLGMGNGALSGQQWLGSHCPWGQLPIVVGGRQRRHSSHFTGEGTETQQESKTLGSLQNGNSELRFWTPRPEHLGACCCWTRPASALPADMDSQDWRGRLDSGLSPHGRVA